MKFGVLCSLKFQNYFVFFPNFYQIIKHLRYEILESQQTSQIYFSALLTSSNNVDVDGNQNIFFSPC